MQKGLRRKLLTLYADAFRTRPYFKSVLLHQPFLPFPIAEKLPAILIPVMPSDLRDETSNDRQNDFRISPTVIVWSSSAGDELDLLKCDAADQVEEALITLGRSASFQSEFSQLRGDERWCPILVVARITLNKELNEVGKVMELYGDIRIVTSDAMTDAETVS